jgi:hypothetical protein
MDHGGAVTFASARFQRRKAGTFGVIGLLLFLMLWSMSANFNSIVAVYMALAGVALGVMLVGFVRSFRIGFIVDDVGVTARSALATKTYRFAEIERAEAVDREARQAPSTVTFSRTPGGGDARVHILAVLWLRNGKRVAFPGLRITSGAHNAVDNWVDDAMREANYRLKQLRGEA